MDRDDDEGGSGAGDRSLRTVFENCQRLFRALDDSDLPQKDPRFQTDVEKALSDLALCSRMVRTLGIFSSNELLEDINTGDLRFLLVDFYAGELEMLRQEGPRLERLRTGRARLESFLFTCYTHGALKPEDKAVLDGETAASASARPRDAAQQRNDKIARFRREKAAKQLLATLQARAAQAARPAVGGTGDAPADEELERELAVTLLDVCVQRAVGSLRAATDEAELLERYEKKREKAAAAGDGTGLEAAMARVDVRAERPTALLSKDGRPFIITNQRERVQAGVFRSGHNLPTMTIDQFLENEIKRGNVLSGGTERPKTPEVDDNDEQAVDAATLKARLFDDFKDSNPRGWGNRGNKG
ncbi:hypothetical protein HK405_013996 [Cladochytrium tenue]|nr:hypothetical protein HK405_013996 [Cladochytrium tenue]